MTSIVTRSSVLAVVKETSESVPIAPTTTDQYVALQNDVSMSPSFDEITNDEMKNSIGMSKSVLGFENPTFSFSHYMYHSGTEGVAPEISELLEAGFGSKTVNSTERIVVGISTTSVVGVDAGSDFPLGTPMLFKSSLGYELLPSHGFSTNDVTMGFNLTNAQTGPIYLGKAITFFPENYHNSLSLFHFLGNGGATEMISGAKVTEITIDIAAGEAINTSFSLEGIKFFFNPIEITDTTKYLDFEDDNGVVAAILTAKFYRDPHELASALQTAMQALTSETIEVTYDDSTGKFTIGSSTSTVFELPFATGANTANSIAAKIGFAATDLDSATSYTSDTAITFAAPQSGSYDSGDMLVAKSNRVLLGDASDNVCFPASSVSISLSNTRSTINSICAESGRSGSVMNGREVTISISALLEKYDVDKFKRFRSNETTRFFFAGGSKTGGNWDPGKCFTVYCPNTVITSFAAVDNDGLMNMDLELKAFVDANSLDEIVLGFV